MASKRRIDWLDVLFRLCMIALAVCAWHAGRNHYIESGAKAHARGELVVQTLADGSEVVVRVKKDKEAGK